MALRSAGPMPAQRRWRGAGPLCADFYAWPTAPWALAYRGAPSMPGVELRGPGAATEVRRSPGAREGRRGEYAPEDSVATGPGLTRRARWRFADLRVTRAGRRAGGPRGSLRAGEPVNIVVLRRDERRTDGGAVLAAGADFYACPELSRATDAWPGWSGGTPTCPGIPAWSGSDSWRPSGAALDDVRTVAGGPGESAVHPLWRGDDLLFCSDRSGFWELYAAATRRRTGASRRVATPIVLVVVTPPTQRPATTWWNRSGCSDGVRSRSTGAGEVVMRPRTVRRRVRRTDAVVLRLDGGVRAGDGADSRLRRVVDCDSLDAAGDRIVAAGPVRRRARTAIIELRGSHWRAVDAAAPTTCSRPSG